MASAQNTHRNCCVKPGKSGIFVCDDNTTVTYTLKGNKHELAVSGGDVITCTKNRNSTPGHLSCNVGSLTTNATMATDETCDGTTFNLPSGTYRLCSHCSFQRVPEGVSEAV